MAEEASKEKKPADPNFLLGRWMSSPPPGEEIVISGMSGRFPESHNMQEYFEHLLNKRDMITGDGRRWKLDHPEIPQRAGNLYDVDKIDAGYFGLHYRQADIMCCTMRVILETVIESILDAGVNPAELEGTRTGVFLSVTILDMLVDTLMKTTEAQKFPITGYMHSMIANRVSYYLKLKGPSYNVDTACNGAMTALDLAFRAMRTGVCDNAIVSSGHIVLHPGPTQQFFRMGVLSAEGIPRVFDHDASGYVRSETVSSMFLQKSKNSRRIYMKVLNTKLSVDGYKDNGITFPSVLDQKQLMTEIYAECGVSFDALSYFEAHGTGTNAGDPQEVDSIDLAIAKNRTKPLRIGSVKSNIGHTEPASGLATIAKVLLAMETGQIAPNINLKKIKEGMKGFEEGRLIPVVEITKLEEDEAIVGMNNFGFGGTNSSTILQRFNKIKKQVGFLGEDLPRLVCVSGRTKEAVMVFLNDLNSAPIDKEYIGLLHQTFKKTVPGHLQRGFTILDQKGPVKTYYDVVKEQLPSLYIFFGDFNKKAKHLGKNLLSIPIFRTTIQRLNKILSSTEINIEEILTTNSKQIAENNLTAAVAVQLGIAVLLKELKLKVAAVYGDSLGKLVASFYHNMIGLDEAILAISKISLLNKNLKNSVNLEQTENVINSVTNFQNGNNFQQDFFKKNNQNSIVINISDKYLSDGDWMVDDVNTLWEILGSLYVQGFDFDVNNLYPEIEFPVSRGTPMLSSLIKWNHKRSWNTYKYSQFAVSDFEVYNLTYSNEDDKYMQGHVINGRNLVPATEYLRLAWKTFAQTLRVEIADCPVVFRDCRFIRATVMPKSGYINLSVTIQRGTGDFEILENDTLVANGKISQLEADYSFVDLPQASTVDDRRQFLDQEEIYRELSIRGYDYSGSFKGVMKSNIEGSSGLIKWDNNWTIFMDTMLHFKTLQLNTKLLVVPIGIRKVIIDPVKHLKTIEKLDQENILIPAFANEESNIVRSGGIEISGLQPRSIAKRKEMHEPLIEKYAFVSNKSCLNIAEAVRIDTQIVHENNLDLNFKAIEIIDDFSKSTPKYLLPIVSQCLDDTPFVSAFLTISTKNTVEDLPSEIVVEDVALTPESNLVMIIGSNLLQRPPMLKTVLGALCNNGFVLTRENLDFCFDPKEKSVELFTEYTTENEKILLLKKREPPVSTTQFIEFDEGLDWFPVLQNALKKPKTKIVVYGKKGQANGILGIINCIRREPGGSRVKCFYTFDDDFDFNLEEFSQKTEMAINVFKNYERGTYRHVLLAEPGRVQGGHYFVNNSARGDLSSLAWFEGSITPKSTVPKGKVLIYPYYSSLNFDDILIASGRVGVDSMTTNPIEQDCVLGFEFSGRDSSGRRVAGITNSKAMATMLFADTGFLFDVPDHWTLEDAATVPLVYLTVTYGLLVLAKMKPGASILIHSATGGIGLPAINVCRYFGCNIFLTISTQEKRDYIREHFPDIPDSHIATLLDTSFEETIMGGTKGRGVDIVLNALSGEQLQASIRCLNSGGHLVEIGKVDLAGDSPLGLQAFEKELKYHGITLDGLLSMSDEAKKELRHIVSEGIKIGFIKPLPRVVFKPEEVEQAFRFMIQGKHTGKVCLKIREENEDLTVPKKILGVNARFNGDELKSYIVIGGLGGIALELADWIVLRGAKKLVLTTRSGVQTGYQTRKIRTWESYGVTVRVVMNDATTERKCINLINEANKLGPVDGVFNLAAILENGLFENQTRETFQAVMDPKATVTKFMDVVTRKLCPELRYFVVYSTLYCRGTTHLSNYVIANSIMESICERRKKDGLPGLAIQWGATAIVGIVARLHDGSNEFVEGGTVSQSTTSTFKTLDKLMHQDNPVVGSAIIAAKNNQTLGVASAVKTISTILGIKDIKTVNQHATLAELGMDSMTGAEVLQVLEKDFEIYLSSKEVRELTLFSLGQIEEEKKELGDASKPLNGANLIIHRIPHKGLRQRPVITKIPSQIKDSEKASSVFVLPGIEGVFKPLEPLAKRLKAHVFGIQYDYENPEYTIEECAAKILEHIEPHMSKTEIFSIVGYSFGVNVGLEIIHLLEEKGYNGRFVAIDGAPRYLRTAMRTYLASENEAEFETVLLTTVLRILLSEENLENNKEQLLQCKDFTERINFALSLIPSDVTNEEQLEEQGVVALYARIGAIEEYKFSHQKIKSEVLLLKAKSSLVIDDEDYGLSSICEKSVNVKVLEGDHITILRQSTIADEVNKFIP